MASVELLKGKRTSAKERFTRTVTTLTEAIDDTNNDIDTMESMYDDVNNAWKNVIEKHEDYTSAADFEELEPDSELWINEIQARYNDIRKVYNKKRFEYDNAVLRNNARRSRDVSHANFLHLSSNADEMIRAYCSAASLERERSLIKLYFEEAK